MKLSFSALLLPALFCANPLAARADNIQIVAPYSQSITYEDPGPYQPPTVIGSFNILPDDLAMTISGTFGNSLDPTSAGADIYLGALPVGQCFDGDVCTTNGAPWTDTLTAPQIASLGVGTVNLIVVQTSEFNVQLGATTLDQTPALTAEPSSLALLGTGLLGACAVARRRIHA